MLDQVAQDLATWIDKTGDEVARAFAPGRAPFAAPITEEQKLEYYRDQLFNPDGSPNVNGRNAQMARLGPRGFAMVYKAIVARFPQLQIPTPPDIKVPDEWPTAPPAGPPGLPPGPPPGPPGPPGG